MVVEGRVATAVAMAATMVVTAATGAMEAMAVVALVGSMATTEAAGAGTLVTVLVVAGMSAGMDSKGAVVATAGISSSQATTAVLFTSLLFQPACIYFHACLLQALCFSLLRE